MYNKTLKLNDVTVICILKSDSKRQMSKVYPVFLNQVFNFSQYFIFQSVMTILLMDGNLILTVTVTLIPKSCVVNGAPKIGMG